MEILKLIATAGLAVCLYQSIGWGIDAAIAAQTPPPKGESPMPGESRR